MAPRSSVKRRTVHSWEHRPHNSSLNANRFSEQQQRDFNARMLVNRQKQRVSLVDCPLVESEPIDPVIVEEVVSLVWDSLLFYNKFSENLNEIAKFLFSLVV